MMYAIHADDRPNVTKQTYVYFHRKGQRFDNVASCRAVSNPASCRIFREKSCFSPLNLGTLFRCCALRKGTSPSNASLDSGKNENQVG